MIRISRYPGEGRTRYQQRIATTRALEAAIAARSADPVDAAFERLNDEMQKTAAMTAGGR